MGKHDDSSDDSDSDGGSDDYEKKHKKEKKKKDKKDKKDKHKDHGHENKYGWNEHQNAVTSPHMPAGPSMSMPQFPLAPLTATPMLQPDFSSHNNSAISTGRVSPRPVSRQSQAPPSGFRIPLTSDAPFPPPQQAGPPAAMDGSMATYFGSALFPNSVHPCKIVPQLDTMCRVPYGGSEWEHRGRFDLLPYREDTMELVPAREGKIPHGRRPVEGGYEEGGEKLYHALGVVNGVKVPGKTGEHLWGANVCWGGQEHSIVEYEILCWRY